MVLLLDPDSMAVGELSGVVRIPAEEGDHQDAYGADRMVDILVEVALAMAWESFLVAEGVVSHNYQIVAEGAVLQAGSLEKEHQVVACLGVEAQAFSQAAVLVVHLVVANLEVVKEDLALPPADDRLVAAIG